MSATPTEPESSPTEPESSAALETPPEPARRRGLGRRRSSSPDRIRRGDGVPTRLAATAGILGVDVALAAILVSQNVQGWIVGLVLGLVSIAGMAIVWGTQKL
jgi:hypothetical protein